MSYSLLLRIISHFLMIYFEVIYQTWDAVFHHQMKHREESWKYDAQRSIFDELRGVSSGDETLCRMFDISSQTKSFLKEKLRMQKWAVFHLISFEFSLWVINEFEISEQTENFFFFLNNMMIINTLKWSIQSSIFFQVNSSQVNFI